MLIVTLVGAWIEVWIVGIIWGGFVEVNKGEWGTDSIGLDKGFVAWYLWAKKNCLWGEVSRGIQFQQRQFEIMLENSF